MKKLIIILAIAMAGPGSFVALAQEGGGKGSPGAHGRPRDRGGPGNAEYYKISPAQDPLGPTEGFVLAQVVRGAGWPHSPVFCRSAFRHGPIPEDKRHTHLGFRVVLVR